MDSSEKMDKSCTIQVSEEIKLYGYRWIIIIIFGLYSAINFLQFMQFNIIASEVVQPYYGVSPLLADMAGLVFMMIFILLFIPISYFVERTGLKTTSIACAGFTALGNCLKLLATSPGSFYLILVSQSFCAISQIFVLIIPTKIACVWFGPEEVSTACSIGLFGTQLGLALGSVVPVLMVHYSEDSDLVERDLWTMFLYNAIVSVVIFIIVVIFFRSKPELPPSQSQADLIRRSKEVKLTYWAATKELAKNRDFLIILFAFGISFGIWNSLAVLINQMYAEFFPDDHGSALGVICFGTVIVGGCFGTWIFGYLLDKTHAYKSISFLVLVADVICFIAQSVAMLARSRLAVFIFLPLYGFFSSCLMVISFEYATETTYPIHEEYGLAILNAVVYMFAIIYVIILSFVFEILGYLVGFVMLVISLVLSAIAIFFISPELKRRNANLRQTNVETPTS